MSNVPHTWSAWLSGEPIGRRPYFAVGFGLSALKLAIDWAVSRAFDQPWSPLLYLGSFGGPWLGDDLSRAYGLTLWAVALPFIAIGVWLTVRRLRDVGLPPALVVLFFLPLANLAFLLALCAVPSRMHLPGPGARGPERSGPFTAVLVGGLCGAAVAIGMVEVAVGLLGGYGASLFLGAPTVSAFTATFVAFYLGGSTARTAACASMLALGASGALLLALSVEGAVCLFMAAPLALVSSLLGYALARMLTSYRPATAGTSGPAALAVLPVWLLGELLVPLPAEPERWVESAIEIDAPPSLVWRRVLAFERLPEPDELLFRAGIAYPIEATIEGAGVGAIRRCHFTTGDFVEPITAWRPGRELAFDVTQQPDPLRELTPLPGPRPPHLDGFFATTRGQFLLEPLPGGGTRLRGRTAYRLEIFPRSYWALWSDAIVHRIHLRVLHQIERLAERDHALDARAAIP